MQPGNALKQLRKSTYAIPDPGDGKYVEISQNFQYLPIVSAGVETRILRAPNKAGLDGKIGLTTDGGTVTVSVLDSAGATTGTIALDDAADYVTLSSIETSAGVYAWRVDSNFGCTVSAALGQTVSTAATQTLTNKTLTAPTLNSPVINLAIGASTSAAGSSSADAGALPSGGGVYPTTAATDTAGVIISAADNVAGRMIFIGNGVANKILKVYAPGGGTINGGSANAAFVSVSGKGVIAQCLTAATSAWLAW